MSQYFTPVSSGTTPTNVAITFTTNSGIATVASNNVNVLGIGSVATSGSGSTIDITSTASVLNWTDESTPFNAASNNGYFITGAITGTLPAASQGNVVQIATTQAGPTVIQAQAGQFIQIGTHVSSLGGSATSGEAGDTLFLVYRNASSTWYALSVSGTWTLA